LGGSDSDVGLALAVDKGGNVYVSGITASPDFPLQAPLQNTLGASGNDFLSKPSAFVAELNSAGTALRFSSYLGDNAGFDAVGSMFAGGIALDASNNVYVAGLTESTAFTITHGAFQTSCKLDSFGICTDAFVSKITFPASPAVLLTNRAPTFAPLLLGKTSALSLKVLNQGTAVLNISSVKFSCPAPSCTELRLSSNGCGSAVPAGSSCALQISFSPNKEGDQFASLTLVDNASISPQSVNITANGTVFAASPGLIVFAPQKVGTTSPPQTITLVNHSSAAISLSSTTILTRDYKVAATCASIAADATCKTTVTFTPQFVGPRPDLVAFTDANGGQGLVNLSGSGK
jgi:hypothetical protein